MITQYQFEAEIPGKLVPSSSWGYWLYSAIMQWLPPEVATQYHEQSLTPFNQSFVPQKDQRKGRWTITALTDEAEMVLFPIVEDCRQIYVKEISAALPLQLKSKQHIPNLETFLNLADALEDRHIHPIVFRTPCTFKSHERYQIFPSVSQILQSLISRWNAIAPGCAISDGDAIRMLEEQIWIRDYRLRGARYDMKGQRILGFCGTIWVQNRLPVPLLEIWKILLLFANYAGIGVKTSLGMGAVESGTV